MTSINLNKVSDLQQHNVQDVVAQGSLSLGGKNYSVTVVNEKLQVSRQGLGNWSVERLANGIKDFFGRLFNEGSLATRSSRLQDQLQGMMQAKEAKEAKEAKVQQHVRDFRTGLQDARQFIQDHHSLQNFTAVCTQCMSDDPTTQQFLSDNFNNPAFGRDRFTGIEDHPTDAAKFIAKFGDQQIEFSNRSSTNLELRGEILKKELTEGNFQNLGDLISRDYLTEKDSLLTYCLTPHVLELNSQIGKYPPAMRNQIIEAIVHESIGNTTVGQTVPHLLPRG
jgi:hypothetical protein